MAELPTQVNFRKKGNKFCTDHPNEEQLMQDSNPELSIKDAFGRMKYPPHPEEDEQRGVISSSGRGENIPRQTTHADIDDTDHITHSQKRVKNVTPKLPQARSQARTCCCRCVKLFLMILAFFFFFLFLLVMYEENENCKRFHYRRYFNFKEKNICDIFNDWPLFCPLQSICDHFKHEFG